MKGLLEEILEIPEKARLCLENNKDIKLPLNVPYIGMGSSYFAPLTLFYAGKEILPQIASEFYYYLSPKTLPSGVLLSQSGESSETVWCLEKFAKIVALTNKKESTIGTSEKTQQLIEIHAGEEKFSSTKTYVNTLIALYLGLGIDPSKAVEKITQEFESYKNTCLEYAKSIYDYQQSHQIKGLYVIGSGPNIGTALEGALTLSETTKLSWIGMATAQYDHGPKETANDTVVILLNSHGKDRKRVTSVKETLRNNSNALVIELVEDSLPEELAPLTLIVQLNFIMNYLADVMFVGDTFTLGGKVTTVDSSVK